MDSSNRCLESQLAGRDIDGAPVTHYLVAFYNDETVAEVFKEIAQTFKVL